MHSVVFKLSFYKLEYVGDTHRRLNKVFNRGVCAQSTFTLLHPHQILAQLQ